MSVSVIKHLLMQKGYLVLNKFAIDLYGIEAAALLSLLAELDDRFSAENDGWFYLTAVTAQQDLSIGRRGFDAAMKSLSDKGIITSRLAGVPAKKWYKLNYDALYSEFERYEQARLHKTYNQGCTGRANLFEHSEQAINNKEYINKKEEIKDTHLSPTGDAKKFRKPSFEEIEEYIREQGYAMDASYFYDYYESNGWCVGRKPMKDWKAAVRNWMRNEKLRSNGNNTGNRQTSIQYGNPIYGPIVKEMERELGPLNF